MKHNYQSVSKATGATLISFSILLIIFDSTWIWMDVYSGYFWICSWTFGTGIIAGGLGIAAGSLGVSVSKNKELVDFFVKFGPTAAMGNAAGSVAAVFYGYITWCVFYHLYGMPTTSGPFWGSFVAVVICEWIFLTLVMALSFFQANFIGCTCCCRDPSDSGAIEPVNEAVVPTQGYPNVPYQGYPSQGQPEMMPTYGQPYGQYHPYPAPKEVEESSSDSSDSSSSDSDSD